MRNRIFSGSAIAAATVALCLAAPARAEEQQKEYNDFEFTPFIGHMAGGEFEDPTDNSSRDLDADTDFGIFIDAAASDWWQHYEMLFVSQSTRVKGATPFDLSVEYLQFGGTVAYPEPANRVIPYFGMTVGAARFSPDGAGLDDETKFAFTIGGGVRVPINEHFGIRLDLRAFGTVLDSEGDLFCVSSAGLTCRVKAKGDLLMQYSANLGVIIGF
jgi:opacity protein-like surface antigen